MFKYFKEVFIYNSTFQIFLAMYFGVIAIVGLSSSFSNNDLMIVVVVGAIGLAAYIYGIFMARMYVGKKLKDDVAVSTTENQPTVLPDADRQDVHYDDIDVTVDRNIYRDPPTKYEP